MPDVPAQAPLPASSAAPSPSGASPRPAWQPFTPRGLAAFAHASFGRVWLVHWILALIAAGAVVHFLAQDWCPVIRDAIQALPAEGVIRQRALHTPIEVNTPLASSRFLGLAVERSAEGRSTLGSDVRIELAPDQFRICSLTGCRSLAYPDGWEIAFNRPELEPWWGAWQPILLWIAGVGTVLWLLLVWAVLATVYAPFVWLFAYLKDRPLKLGACWRIAGAGLVPPGLFFTAGIIAYGYEGIDLIRFVLGAVLHVPLAWVWIALGVLALPRIPVLTPVRANPFAPAGPPAAN